jgi:hypothetical protein
MRETVKMSAARAGPAAGLRVRVPRVSHFVHEATFEAACRFASDELLFVYDVLHVQNLSIENLLILARAASRLAGFSVRRTQCHRFRSLPAGGAPVPPERS